MYANDVPERQNLALQSLCGLRYCHKSTWRSPTSPRPEDEAARKNTEDGTMSALVVRNRSPPGITSDGIESSTHLRCATITAVSRGHSGRNFLCRNVLLGACRNASTANSPTARQVVDGWVTPQCLIGWLFPILKKGLSECEPTRLMGGAKTDRRLQGFWRMTGFVIGDR